MFEDIQHKFISSVLQEFKNVFEIYISNTSSASDIHRGLVAIGMFLLQWDATESIQRYEQVAAKTFGRRKALISRALQLIVAYVEDGQYSLDAVQEAFRKTFNSNLQMFNPLRNDTKVAVTTTAVDDSLSWLFTNYNGENDLRVLDDAKQIPSLKAAVIRQLEEDKATLTPVVDSMLASMFYFELDALPIPDGNGYLCLGYIHCRLDLPVGGLRYLYDRLLETSSWFLVQGSPIQCVQFIPRGPPPFKRRINFRVESMDEVIAFSLGGITSTTTLISGFPTRLEKLIEDQSLVRPFGTLDHVVSEKPLPATPVKRPSIIETSERVHDAKRPRVKTGFF
ncbi:unnamed protein product [Alternaria alternata]